MIKRLGTNMYLCKEQRQDHRTMSNELHILDCDNQKIAI